MYLLIQKAFFSLLPSAKLLPTAEVLCIDNSALAFFYVVFFFVCFFSFFFCSNLAWLPLEFHCFIVNVFSTLSFYLSIKVSLWPSWHDFMLLVQTNQMLASWKQKEKVQGYFSQVNTFRTSVEESPVWFKVNFQFHLEL